MDKVQLQTDITQALKAGDKNKAQSLRFLMAQIQDAEIANQRQDLSEDQLNKLLNNQIKKLKESLTMFQQAKRDDLVKKNQAELEILQAYLPQQLSTEDLSKKVEEIINQNPNLKANPGALIGLAVKQLAGQADNAQIAQLVKQKLG